MSRFSLTESKLLVDLDEGLVYSPSSGRWVKATVAVAEALDGTAIPDDKAKELMADPGSLRDPLNTEH